MNYTKDGTTVIDATGKEWPVNVWHPIPIPDGLEPRAIEQNKIDSHPVIIFWDHWLLRPPLPELPRAGLPGHTMTTETQRWANRLKRLIKETPPGITALVHHQSITICESEVLRRYEEEHGHRDNVPYIELLTRTSVFEPNSEST